MSKPKESMQKGHTTLSKKVVYLKVTATFAVALVFITIAGLMTVFGKPDLGKLQAAQTVVLISSWISLAVAVVLAITHLKTLRLTRTIVDKMRLIRSNQDFNHSIDIGQAKPFDELVAEINSLLSIVQQDKHQINEMSEVIRQHEHENQLLLLELEYSLCLAQEEAETDVLTGLYNRKVIEERFECEIEKSAQLEFPMSVIMADLDHFKKVNDTFGHQIGDEVLKIFAKMLKESVRSSDIVARYGGEEFIIVLPETPAEYAIKIAQRVNAKFTEAVKGELDELRSIDCTVSMGVADYPTCGAAKDDLVSAADAALFKAKQNGRNCVVYYGDIQGLKNTA